MRNAVYAAFAFVVVGSLAATSEAQVVVYREVLPSPAGVYAAPPVTTVYSPIVSPTLPAYVAPAPIVYQPVIAARPIVAYRSVVRYRPIVSYSPVVTPYGVPVAPPYVSVGRPVVVRTKAYIPGQPIRNVLRAVTP